MRARALSFLLTALCLVGPNAHAEPVKLTDSELDAVTAGAVYVSADAWALAAGNGALAEANTYTHTGGTGIIEWGIGRATARACCGPQTDAEVALNGTGDGPFVATLGLIDKGVGLELASGQRQYATATGFIVVLSIDPTLLRLVPIAPNSNTSLRASPPLVARLARPLLHPPEDGNSNSSTSQSSGTIAHGLAVSDANGLDAAASYVSSFAGTLLNWSAATATSISLRD